MLLLTTGTLLITNRYPVSFHSSQPTLPQDRYKGLITEEEYKTMRAAEVAQKHAVLLGRYRVAIALAKAEGCKSVAFSLLSTGTLRGSLSIEEVLVNTLVPAIEKAGFDGEFYLVAFTSDEHKALTHIYDPSVDRTALVTLPSFQLNPSAGEWVPASTTMTSMLQDLNGTQGEIEGEANDADGNPDTLAIVNSKAISTASTDTISISTSISTDLVICEGDGDGGGLGDTVAVNAMPGVLAAFHDLKAARAVLPMLGEWNELVSFASREHLYKRQHVTSDIKHLTTSPHLTSSSTQSICGSSRSNGCRPPSCASRQTRSSSRPFAFRSITLPSQITVSSRKESLRFTEAAGAPNSRSTYLALARIRP